MEIVDLNHGELDVKLLFCNKSQRDAAVEFEQTQGQTFNGKLGLADYALKYIYHSYRHYCLRNRIEQKYDAYEFDELLTDPTVEQGKSNLSEVMEKIGNTMVSTLERELEKQESQKKTNSKSGMDLKPISVAS